MIATGKQVADRLSGKAVNQGGLHRGAFQKYAPQRRRRPEMSCYSLGFGALLQMPQIDSGHSPRELPIGQGSG